MTLQLVDWIDVGEVSAERDSNLSHYFFDAGVSKTVIGNSRQFLLLGRKGAGKTAVFLHLQSKPNNIFGDKDLIAPLSLANYNWQAHTLLANRQKGAGFQHRDSWRFIIAIETIRCLSEKLSQTGTAIPHKLQQAQKILEKLFSNPVPSWLDLLGTKLFRLSKLHLPSGSISPTEEALKIDAGEISFTDLKSSPSLVETLNQNIETLTNFFEEAITQSLSGYKIFLIFDRLDEGWVQPYLEECKEIISGLLHASEHSLQKFNGSLRPIVFLREDIFKTLAINDRNKLREDCSSTLMWNLETLEKLLLERINFYAKKAGAPAVESLENIFDKKEMRSRTAPIKHIFNRTMCRPRDMVAFLRKTIMVIKNGATPSLFEEPENSNKDVLKADAIYEAEPSYSDYLYEEISDEWRNQDPDFLNYLSAIENLRYAVFKEEDFEAEIQKKLGTLDRSRIRLILRFLFDSSIIGFKVGDSQIWRFKCFIPNQGFIDSSQYKVHPGLIRRMGLTEGSLSSEDKSQPA